VTKGETTRTRSVSKNGEEVIVVGVSVIQRPVRCAAGGALWFGLAEAVGVAMIVVEGAGRSTGTVALGAPVALRDPREDVEEDGFGWDF
jgi:hypothetical protein